MAVKNSDMYYAYSNNEGIKEKGEYGGVVTTIMKHLLESNVVDGIVAVKEGFDLYDAVPCLITDPEEVIKTAGSIHCGTVNLASFIYKYLDGCRDMKIAVTCKPCDAMSIRELMKKGKIIEDNVIMIGVNCGGTLPPVPTMQMIRDVYELDPSDVIKEEIAKGKLIMETAEGEKGFGIEDLEEDGMGRRENCQRCDLKIPSNADLALGNWGVIGPLAGKATFVEVFSDKGADILNDVWAGLYDGQMLALSAEKNVPIILMHNQKEEKYNDVTENVCTFLSQRTQAALEAGVAKENIWIDPGFGFAKNVQHNIDLLRGLDKVVGLGYPVLFGISRKRVVDFLLGGNIPAKDRDQGTAALSAYAVSKGCQIVRVHNVEANRDVVKTISGIL